MMTHDSDELARRITRNWMGSRHYVRTSARQVYERQLLVATYWPPLIPSLSQLGAGDPKGHWWRDEQ